MPDKPVSGLDDMLAGMAPWLHAAPYRFLALPHEDAGAEWVGEPFALIREDEAATVVIEALEPEPGGALFARITLQLQSDLEGVGLTAAVSAALAEAGIACNAIAGYHHDHLFVPWTRREQALGILQGLSEDARR
ncbi:ACT domain-containing protein [Erythrobacter sp. JK5]|uniref:ACT domain-containing protein n=1 Tax=Erythrobacter sp. JK5 TaxID=2829500 RepID=UPI001BA68AFB|nr:ACT domain-containing protein [Erythrobacter sp. JK5]QUL36725.1 ACT domain-containing protein [Erythrobacter sp. JK5]